MSVGVVWFPRGGRGVARHPPGLLVGEARSPLRVTTGPALAPTSPSEPPRFVPSRAADLLTLRSPSGDGGRPGETPGA